MEVKSFSLIGKIGRDGDAFFIGASLTFTPTTTGTLFLACNDGVNFQDNDGYWNVTVTFEEEVQLAPSGYGSNPIYADRVNGSFVDTWGVILTIQTGFTTPPEWDETAMGNLEAAFSAVDSRLQAQTGRTFKDVFGGLELRFYPSDPDVYGVTFNENLIRFGQGTRTTATRSDNRGFGRINAPTGLDYYPSDSGFFEADSKGIQNTVIHELGHVLDFRSSDFKTTASSFGLPALKGSGTLSPDAPDDVGTFWEHSDVSGLANPLDEWLPDHFLNWVRNSYVGIEGDIDDYGAADPGEEQRASAYWVGGITYNGHTSPGIDGFSSDATAYADAAADLLRSLGTGEPCPECNC